MTLQLMIERDTAGDFKVQYPSPSEDLVPPSGHDRKLDWIRSSATRFYTRVREIDELHKSIRLPLEAPLRQGP